MQNILNALKKYKWWLVLLLVTAVGGYYAYGYVQQQNKPAPTGRPYKVERGDLVSIVSATGTLSPVNNVDVSSKITGRIVEVLVNENDMVRANQVIIILDDQQLQAQEAQAKAKLLNASVTLERTKQLQKVGAVPTQQLDADQMSYDVAKAVYENAASNLDDTIIRAPIAGQIIGKPIPAGQTVAPGISNPMVLLTVADLKTMQIQALIDESDIGQVKLGQIVSFTVDAYPDKTFDGTVSIISNKANIQQNVVYYTVYIDVKSPEGLLKPTMTARVSVHVGERKNVLVIPTVAIKDNKGQRFVQLMGADGQPQSVKVSTGLTSEDKIEVTSGLKEGDTIILPQAKAQTSGGPGGGANIFRAPTR
jgi:RND family efflux transporter MFP subunit